jgi:bifunctional DNA-binding transcriptional regulator/antitoxin component of YhaV-PrlF toxin-antitoxin module
MAERFNIKPGDQIEWEAAGETIRVVPARKRAKSTILPQDRLKHFDRATQRQREREKTLDRVLLAASAQTGRGWKRDSLYDRDGAD